MKVSRTDVLNDADYWNCDWDLGRISDGDLTGGTSLNPSWISTNSSVLTNNRDVHVNSFGVWSKKVYHTAQLGKKDATNGFYIVNNNVILNL